MSSTITAVNVDGIQFDRNDFLGSGRFGSVYRGTYKGQSIAVKRIKKRSDGFPSIEELKVWQQLDHPNVVKLLHYVSDDDDDFTYLALELCDASLDQVFLNQDDPRKYKGPALTNHVEVFSQLASGLEYIHSKNLVHGNIKPENILISVKPTDCGDKVTIKWSDFEFSKAVDERETFTTSGIKGGPLWFAPELFKMFGENLSLEKTSKEGDVFAEGLVFGYILIKGRHLYGEDSHSIMENLKDNKPVYIDKIHKNHWAPNLIEYMVTKPPATRLTSKEVHVRLQYIKIRLVEEEKKLLQQFERKKSDFMNLIKDFSQRGLDVNAKSQSKKNALHFLCGSNSTPNLTDAIRLLVELGIDVNAKGEYERNALHLLCLYNSTPNLIDAIRLLVELGIDVNAKDKYEKNALHFLCGSNSTPNLTDAIRLLVELGIDVNAKSQSKKNALHFLCGSNSTPNLTDAIRLLVELGIDVNAKGEYERNALHLLCLYNSTPNLIDAIRLLVELGIDVNAKDKYEKNALHFLCGSNSTPNLTDAIRLLVELGIDVNAKDKYEKNALHILCLNNSTPNLTDAIRLLVELGIDVNEKGDTGMNALHYLCLNNSTPNLTDAIRLLVELGIDVNAKDEYEKNALHILCLNNSTPNLTDAIRLLVELGIDVNEKGDTGMNALHYLCLNNSTPNLTDAIRLLVELGIDVNAKDEYEKNALHYLCLNNSTPNLTDAIRLLVELGIDVNAMDEMKRKAVNFLREYRRKEERQKYEKREGQFVDEAIQFLENAAITDFSKLKYGEYKHDRFKFVEEEEKLHQMDPQEFSSVLPGISGVSIHDDNVITKDKGKRNALHVLCQSDSSSNLINEIKRLIKIGYNVNDKDKDGRNALHYLCQDNSSSNLVEAIKLFIDTGIDAKEKDNDEWNALHYLCRFNSSSDLRDAIQMLIKHGIDANEKTNDGCNTLHFLCQNHSTSNFIDVIQILIQQGIDVKEKDKNGRNALFFLIRNSNMDNHLKSNVFRFLIRHGIQVHSENEESCNLYQDFFKENDNCGKICFDFLVKEEIRLGWHDACENCQQILSITESPRVRLQHHQMFSSCYGVFHLLMKHLEKWAKSNQRPGESELDMSKPTKWLREKAEQYGESETGKSFKEDFEVMADVSEQVKKGSNSSEFNCDHYERYLRSMYSIAEMTDAKESMGQNKWFYLLPFDFPIDYGDEKESDIKRAKMEWDRTLFSWAHKETDEYYGTFMKEDANDGFFLPKEFKHKCHEIDGKSQNHYVEQLFRGMLETNANKRMTSLEIAKQMKSIENKLYEKEEELRQLCATDSSPALVQKIRDITSLGIDVNAMDKDGRNALHYLCQHNSSSTLIDAIKLLIELGICIMSNGHDARTILRQHYNKSDIEEIIELLDEACSLLA
ncbi:uncharacterized protein LOC116924688 isoform X1 [Daphnia magna]|uniref:uncharacterized protein LOC116924688 isoform X1 n=1 Tax=Daphnia magna TaxID=35525 RepID=UPI001E1BB512|nr:uncharacterized protein LOC116924688 isoform X1 [Daphnia magna]